MKYNIIHGGDNIYSCEMKPGLLDQQIFNRKKGVTEFRDLMGASTANINPDHRGAYESNPDVFRRQNGIFTHLYNAAARFGETKVFKA